MRHVIVKDLPPQEWLDKAEQITELLRNASSNDERQQIIKDNEAHWRKDSFRKWLIDQFHRKCWYSEAKESVSSYHIDHFRPKGRVKELNGPPREGYWWLAFRWENYRISGQLLNVKKSDIFPLNGRYRAQPFDEDGIQLEAPILLDPCIAEEAWLISFNEGGEATYAEDIDDDDKFRVEQTIEILGLNRNTKNRLVENRSEKWNECLQIILDYQKTGVPQALKKVYRALAIKQLKELVKYEKEFSSVALACIKKSAPEPVYKQVIG